MRAKDGWLTRYADQIVGVLGCHDRLVLPGRLTAIAHPEAMAGVLRREHIRCFDLEQYVEPIREQIRQNAERIAAEHGRQIHCPPSTRFTEGYHWSVMQAEYALDIVFRRAEDLRPVYEEISRQAVLTVKSDQMARFWDKRLSPEAKATSRFCTRVEGTCIRHHLGRQSLKMYDRGGRVLRIEATSNDITFFTHHRKVVHRDGSSEYKVAALKKSIYSLTDLDELMAAACRRYLDFVGTLEDRSPQRHDLDRISRPAHDERDRSWRGFNFFLTEDLTVLLAVLRGEFALNGLSGRRLRAQLAGKTSGQIGRMLKRLRLHGLIRRVGHTYRYYLTSLGRRALVAARKLTEYLIIPALQPVPQ